mmetsp:Transcript_6858/g.24394  ORF Transcript_6858/g.24394 Transcript_6858/m.24394 type:complete len:206 (+) Transcript_6858:394-1011(+)
MGAVVSGPLTGILVRTTVSARTAGLALAVRHGRSLWCMLAIVHRPLRIMQLRPQPLRPLRRRRTHASVASSRRRPQVAGVKAAARKNAQISLCTTAYQRVAVPRCCGLESTRESWLTTRTVSGDTTTSCCSTKSACSSRDRTRACSTVISSSLTSRRHGKSWQESVRGLWRQSTKFATPWRAASQSTTGRSEKCSMATQMPPSGT